MKKFIPALPVLLIVLTSLCIPGFKEDQKKFPRVREAYSEKENALKQKIEKAGLKINGIEMFIRAFKQEKKVEVWLKNKGQKKFVHFIDYDICASSGVSGPKRKRGDDQVPEGFYYINNFNPTSDYYLSLQINYPNKSDKILGAKDPGDFIFIHGNCVTIGCIPITDDKIKELYILAVEAKNQGQKEIPVHIFPAKFSDANYNSLKKQNSSEKNLIAFWENIKPGFDFFEKNKELPSVSIDKKGKYVVK